MKISIIGTNGFLSTAIGVHANNKGYLLDTYGLDAPIAHGCDKFFKVNLMTDDVDYRTILDSDLIVYASGAGIQSNMKESVELVYGLNVIAPINLCNFLKTNNFKGVLVTFGSFFEMGETKEQRCFTEKDILTSMCKAPNEYTSSKRVFSRFVQSYAHDFVHWHFILPTIYGKGENPNRLIPYTINAIKTGADMQFTTGDQTRQYIHVGEIPVLLEMAFENKLADGIYCIEGCDTLTVRELVTRIHHELGRELPADCFGSASRVDTSMKFLALDGRKLLNALNFESKVHIWDKIDSN